MAQVTKGYVFTDGKAGDLSAANLHAAIDGATVTAIKTADIDDEQVTGAKISPTAAIAVGKLAVPSGGLVYGASGVGSVITVGGGLAVSAGVLGLATGTAGFTYIVNGSGVPTLVAMSGDATVSNAGVLTLANSGVTAGAYGSASAIPIVTVDAKGRVTAVSTASLSQPTRYTSGNISIPAAGGLVTQPHGLGSSIWDWNVRLVNTSADLGFVSGQEVDASVVYANDLGSAFTLFADATNIYVQRTNQANLLLRQASATAGAQGIVDTSKWAIKIRATT